MKMRKIFFFLLLSLTFSAFAQTWQVLNSVPPSTGRFEDLWFINPNTGWVVENGGPKRILKTTDGGVSFVTQYIETDTAAFGFRSVAFNNANLGWAGSTSGLLVKTTNGGLNWVRVDSQIFPPPNGFCDMSVIGDSCFFGSGRLNGPTTFVRSTNAGLTYECIDMGAYTNYQVGISFRSRDSGFVVGRSNIITEGAVVCFTSDGGQSWVKRYRSFIQSEHVWNITFVNSQVGYATIEKYIGGNGNIIRTTNGGVTWERITVSNISGVNLDPVGFANANTGWIANHSSNGLWGTTNAGLNWNFINVGNSIHGIFILNDTIGYACGREVLKYTNAVLGIPGNNTILPYKNVLNPNYPNPFNASTVISYTLANHTTIIVEIYNANGEFVEQLEHGYKNKGSYSVTWKADNYPSGVYFYSLRTDQGNDYGKAILVK